MSALHAKNQIPIYSHELTTCDLLSLLQRVVHVPLMRDSGENRRCWRLREILRCSITKITKNCRRHTNDRNNNLVFGLGDFFPYQHTYVNLKLDKKVEARVSNLKQYELWWFSLVRTGYPLCKNIWESRDFDYVLDLEFKKYLINRNLFKGIIFSQSFRLSETRFTLCSYNLL